MKRQHCLFFNILLVVVSWALFPAQAATKISTPSAIKMWLAQTGLPYAQWPRSVPGEGILTLSPETIMKFGASEITASDFGNLPLPLKSVERLDPRQFRLVWDNEVQEAQRFNFLLEEIRFAAMRLALLPFGNLRPVTIIHGDQATGDAPIPNDPLAEKQLQHGWVGTLKFQQELEKRPNRAAGWTVVIVDSGMAPIDTPEGDPRSKSFVEESGAPGDQKWNEDFGRHGTFIAQVMGGKWGNGIGGHGIAKLDRIWVIKTFLGQLDERGIRRVTATEVDCLKGLQYLRDNLRPGEKAVINVSWSFLGSFIGFEEVFADLNERALLITSAGNITVGGYPDPMYPSTIDTPNNFPVASLEPNGAAFRGKYGPRVRGSAVGVNLLTTFGTGSGSSYVVPQYVAVIYELSREDAGVKPWDIIQALMKGPVVPDERNTFGITRLDPMVSLTEVRRLYPILQAQPNRPPEIRSIRSLEGPTVLSGQAVNLSAEVVDPDGDQITLFWSSTAGQRIVAGQGTSRVIFETAGLAAPAAYEINLSAADEKGATAKATYVINVATPPPTHPTSHLPHRSRRP